jgi:hypothetical protein
MGPRLGAVVDLAGTNANVASKPPIKQRLKASKRRKLKKLDWEIEFLCTIFSLD